MGYPAASGAGAVPHSNRSAAETAALLVLVQGPAAGPVAGRERKRLPVGAARTPGRDARLGTIGDGDRARRPRCSPMAVFYRRRKLGLARFAESY
jgi:hypothetical protein